MCDGSDGGILKTGLGLRRLRESRMTNVEDKNIQDTRNLKDEYKGLANEQVFDRLAEKRSSLEVTIENVDHDFNAGTIVRSANNFNVSRVHIIGRRKYNRRGAMCTDKYLEVVYWNDIDDFVNDQRARGQEIVAIENNVPEVKPLAHKKFVQKTTLLFGSEGNGISTELLAKVNDVREIESLGSTRSINVGVAAGIAMYEWARQCVIAVTRVKSAGAEKRKDACIFSSEATPTFISQRDDKSAENDSNFCASMRGRSE